MPTTQTDLSGNGRDLTYNPLAVPSLVFGGLSGPFPNGTALDVNLGSTPLQVGSYANSAGDLDFSTSTFEIIFQIANTGNIDQILMTFFDQATNHTRGGIACDRGGGPIFAVRASGTLLQLGLGPGAADTWAHLVVTADGVNWQSYLNGVADTAAAGSFNPGGWSQLPLYVGGDAGPDGLEGGIAAAAYYNGVLSGASVLAHYDAISTGVNAYKQAVLADGPAVFWMFTGRGAGWVVGRIGS